VKQQGPSSISFTKGLNFQALLYFPLNFDWLSNLNATFSGNFRL
jgi:hypothetical protein